MRKEVCDTLGELLIDAGNKIKAGTCVMEEEQAMETISLIAHIPMSKETASSTLNMSPSKFDTDVRLNKLPKGRKSRGFKELRWYLDEIVPNKLSIRSLIKRISTC